eukprot:4326890-Ditylum_brightwellii.AAC.1
MDAFNPDQNDQQSNGQGHLDGSFHACNGNGGGANDHPNQHAQNVMEPFDNHISNNPVFCNARFIEVSLAKLEANNAVHQQLMSKYIDLQIIQIITACPKSTKDMYICMTNTMKYNVKFSCLILSKVHSVLHPDGNSYLVYIMEAWSQNINL